MEPNTDITVCGNDTKFRFSFSRIMMRMIGDFMFFTHAWKGTLCRELRLFDNGFGELAIYPSVLREWYEIRIHFHRSRCECSVLCFWRVVWKGTFSRKFRLCDNGSGVSRSVKIVENLDFHFHGGAIVRVSVPHKSVWKGTLSEEIRLREYRLAILGISRSARIIQNLDFHFHDSGFECSVFCSGVGMRRGSV